jgi:chromosome segregation ATPase
VPKRGDAKSLEREVDRLYGLPLDEFTAARNSLARELKRSGDSAAATRVQELKKPSRQLKRAERELEDAERALQRAESAQIEAKEGLGAVEAAVARSEKHVAEAAGARDEARSALKRA